MMHCRLVRRVLLACTVAEQPLLLLTHAQHNAALFFETTTTTVFQHIRTQVVAF
jgi:hypothetical protein